MLGKKTFMRLVSYRSKGAPSASPASFGILVEDGVIDAQGLLSGEFTSVRRVLEEGGLARLASAAEGRSATVALSDVVILPPVPDPTKILCAGINYHTHRVETARSESAYPMLFTRFADTQIGDGALALRPAVTEKFDYEGELAVIIGKTADRVAVPEAMSHVAGYACYNDFSVRDWQRHTSQFLPGKNFKGTGAFGPCLVTADEIADIRKSVLQTWVNGDLRQTASIADMVFSIEELISYISTFTVLHPGDIIVTGTPGGVGLFREPPVFLNVGDHVVVEVSGVGRLSNLVAEAGEEH